MAGKGEGASGVAVYAVNNDSLLNVRVGEDVGDFAGGAGADVEGDGFAEGEVA